MALWKPPSAACCAQRYCAARVSALRSRFHEHAAAAAVNKKTRRSTRTIDREVENRRTCHGYPSSDAVVTGPCAIAVLQAENLLRDVRMPFRPGVAADALHAVADVEIGEELLAAHRPVATDERGIGELMQGRTSIVIAHRLSTVESCDRLIFLQDGRVAAIGRYDARQSRLLPIAPFNRGRSASFAGSAPDEKDVNQ